MKNRQDSAKTIKTTLQEIQREEHCRIDEALMAFGLMAVLAGMTRVDDCRRSVVLKGGTALRLLLGHSIGRISTDIDLSRIDSRLEVDTEIYTGDVRRETANVLAEVFADPAEIQIHLQEERRQPAYPELQQMISFRLFAAYAGTRVDKKAFVIELTLDEYVDQAQLQPVDGAPYGLPIALQAYAPIQAIAEKLRAILQKRQHFDRTGLANNFEPRHVMDLVHLSRLIKPGDIDGLKVMFDLKCDARHVPSHERTRERLLDPRLRAAVEEECRRQGLHASGWEELEYFVARVVT